MQAARYSISLETLLLKNHRRISIMRSANDVATGERRAPTRFGADPSK